MHQSGFIITAETVAYAEVSAGEHRVRIKIEGALQPASRFFMMTGRTDRKSPVRYEPSRRRHRRRLLCARLRRAAHVTRPAHHPSRTPTRNAEQRPDR